MVSSHSFPMSRANQTIRVSFQEDSHRRIYNVPRSALPEFASQPELAGPRAYEVSSAVPQAVFKAFIDSLVNQSPLTVTTQNVLFLLDLAKEFCLPALTSECEAFPIPAAQFVRLSEEVRELRLQLASFVAASTGETAHAAHERVDSQELELEHLHAELDAVTAQAEEIRQSLTELGDRIPNQLQARERAIRADIRRVRSAMAEERERSAPDMQAVRADIENGRRRSDRGIRRVRSETAALRSRVDDLANLAPSVDPQALRSRVETLQQEFETAVLHISRFPLAGPGSLNGIIAALRRKHGARLPDQILKITSSSDLSNSGSSLANLTDLTSESFFFSNITPGQWVCWDFGVETRVCLTDYTIRAMHLASWVLCASVDEKSWVLIDFRTGGQEFKDRAHAASFDVSNRMQFRYLRLHQNGPGHDGLHRLSLSGVEFFGSIQPFDLRRGTVG
jgi:hypothetical protein